MKSISQTSKVILGFSLGCMVYLNASAQLTNSHVWTHPGAMSNTSDLDFIKAKILAKQEPWFSKSEDLRKLAELAYNKTTAPQDQNGATENNMKDDARQCYANALTWYFTGSDVYALKGIQILTVWANTFNGFNPTQGQSQLDCSWIGSLFGPAAELLNGYSAWGATSKASVATMFKTKFYPALNKAPVWNNGNIDLTMAEALFSLAVFCEDIAVFNAAAAKLNGRVPLYFYTKATGNPSNVGEWFSPTTWLDGLMQETCRTGGNHTPGGNDNGHHAQYALAAAIHACEIAWNQGVDLYSQYQNQFVSASELLALQLYSGNMQKSCADNTATTDLWDTFEVGYNHYHNRMKLDMPNTLQLITTRVRTANNGDWNIFYETLTHDLDGKIPVVICGTKAPIVPAIAIDYSLGDVATQLTATGDSLRWYSVLTANKPTFIAPTPSTITAGTIVYSVTQTKNGCESPKTNITVNVLNLFNIPKTTTAPIIDGTLDQVWNNNTFSQSFTKPIVGIITNAADLSGTFKALWDNTYLYILGDVTDDVKSNDSPERYNDDSIELYLDINNDKSTTYGANDVSYNFRWNDGATVGTTPAGRSIANITYSMVAKTGGYVFEARIPWTTLTGTPAIGQLVGFDFHVNDDDDGGTRDGKLSWNAEADNAWQNPTYFGTAKLADVQIPTEVEVSEIQFNSINYYPNPFNESLTIKSSGNFTIYDLTGDIVEKGKCESSCIVGNQLSVGVYLLEVENNGRTQHAKILKK